MDFLQEKINKNDCHQNAFFVRILEKKFKKLPSLIVLLNSVVPREKNRAIPT